LSVKLRLVDRGRQLDLGVRALAVYDGHGFGRVTARNPKQGDDAEGATVVLEFAPGLSVTCNAVERPRRFAVGSRVSPAEQELYRKARPMLAAARQRDGIGE
jgi:hypothetical protein